MVIRLKALANEDTLLRTHCCGHIVADTNVSPFAPTRNICCGHKFCVRVRDTKNFTDFVQKHFVSATYVSQFAQPKKHHGQQCVRNDVSSFTRAFSEIQIRSEWSVIIRVIIKIGRPQRQTIRRHEVLFIPKIGRKNRNIQSRPKRKATKRNSVYCRAKAKANYFGHSSKNPCFFAQTITIKLAHYS